MTTMMDKVAQFGQFGIGTNQAGEVQVTLYAHPFGHRNSVGAGETFDEAFENALAVRNSRRPAMFDGTKVHTHVNTRDVLRQDNIYG